MKKRKHARIVKNFLLIIAILMISNAVFAEENEGHYIATKYGISAVAGKTYDPANNINFYMVSGFALYDYEKVWKHKAPEGLRFKVEGSIGAAHDRKTRLVSSANIFAVYYPGLFETPVFKPYIEGGIGVIYTDFQVMGQGLRLNFNPQLGVGTDISTGSNDTLFFSLRLHHISNGGLKDENRGINSVMCMLGYYF